MEIINPSPSLESSERNQPTLLTPEQRGLGGRFRAVGEGALSLLGVGIAIGGAFLALRHTSLEIGQREAKNLVKNVDDRLARGDITPAEAATDKEKIRNATDPEDAGLPTSAPIPR